MDGYVKIGTELDTKSFDAQIDYVEAQLNEIESQLKKADMGFEVGDTVKLEAQYEKLSTKLSTLRTKQLELNKADFSSVGKSISGIGTKVSSVIKKLGKWVLAVFAVRGAYSLISKAMSTVSNYNDQIKTDIEYIQFALASTMQPIIEKLIELAYQLLGYVALIAKAWFNIDIFANSSASAFKNSNAEAKKLKKTLAGFDEMNVISDTSSTSTTTAPSFDLSNIGTDDVPGWLQWILDNGTLLKGIIAGIAGAIVGLKIISFVSNLGKVVSGIKKVVASFTAFKAGVGLMVTGFALMIVNIVDLIKNWDTLTGKQKAWRVALSLLGGAFITLGYAIATGISVATLGIGAAIALVAGLVGAIVGLVTKFATEEEAILDVATAQERLNEAQDDYVNANDDYITAIENSEEAFKNLKDMQDETGLSGQELYEKVEAGVLDYKDMTDEQRNVYKAYLDNIKAEDELKTSTDNLKEAKDKERIASWQNKLAIMAEKGEYDLYKEAVVNAFEAGELSAEEARDLIGQSMTDMSTASQQTFMEDLPNDIKNGLDPKNYQTTGQKLRNWLYDLVTGIKKDFEDNPIKVGLEAITAVTSGGVSLIGPAIKNKIFNKDGGIVLPKLATGGIINLPNRGIPVGQAIGGEAGAEGVIPLTDSQAMETLGNAIGKYITINATVENKMNGKILSREIQKINNGSNFATNR